MIKSRKKEIVYFGLYFAIIAFILYLSYAIIGQILWKEYNQISMDISTLSSVGAPNQNIIGPINLLYHISMIIFLISFIIISYLENKSNAIKSGCILLFLMEMISVIGYKLFPLVGDKTIMNFQNIMHIVVTILIIFSSIAALYFFAFGYSKENKKFGKFLYISSSIFLIFGLMNPISINLKYDILGITERFTIYTLHLIISIIAIYNLRQNRKAYLLNRLNNN